MEKEDVEIVWVEDREKKVCVKECEFLFWEGKIK